jgi:hypothetical protein
MLSLQSDSETNSHLIMTCAYTLEVWQEINCLTSLNNAWKGNSIEEALKNWCMNKDTKRYKSLPLTIAWGIWLAQNSKLFEDKDTMPLKCAIQSLNILSMHFLNIRKDASQSTPLKKK